MGKIHTNAEYPRRLDAGHLGISHFGMQNGTIFATYICNLPQFSNFCDDIGGRAHT